MWSATVFCFLAGVAGVSIIARKGNTISRRHLGNLGGYIPPHSGTGRSRPRGRRLGAKPKALAVSNVHPYVPEGDPGTPIVE